MRARLCVMWGGGVVFLGFPPLHEYTIIHTDNNVYARKLEFSPQNTTPCMLEVASAACPA